jgi:hypothetical protein
MLANYKNTNGEEVEKESIIGQMIINGILVTDGENIYIEWR